MSEHTKLRRSRRFRIALYSIVVTSIISIAAAGSYSGLFTFARQADEISGRWADDIRILPNDKKRSSAPAPEPACVPPPSGMISWWPGDGNASDIQGPTFENGILHGTATYATGKVGQAFRFDGSQDGYVEVPDNPSLNPTEAFSVDGWFYIDPNAPRGANDIGTLVGKSNGEINSYWSIYFDDRGGSKSLRFVMGANVSYANAIPNANWYHVAGTYDSASIPRAKLYLDGILVADSGPAVFSVTPNNLSLRIGAMHWTDTFGVGNDRLNGAADEVEFLDRAISQEEIQSIYNAGSAGNCKGLCTPPPSGMVGWWPGNGNASDIVNGNNGTLVNGVSYASGRVDQAFSFNQVNQQYVALPESAAALLNNSAGSITAWVNPSAVGEFDMIAAFGTGNPGEAVGFAINNGNVRIYHHTDPFDWQTAIPVSINSWSHLTYTWDGTTERLYKNGVLADSRPRNFNYVNAGYARIGFGFINDPSVFFPGLIDEVTIFNRTLDAAEAASIFNANGAGVCPHCVAPPSNVVSWWPAENNANDRLGRNNAVLHGDATFAAGIVGQAFSFDGSGDFAQIVSTSSLPTGASPRTVELWFKTPVDLSSQTESGIFQYGSASNGNMFGLITSLNAPGKLYFYGHSADLAGTTTLLPNRWYHGAVTYDGFTVKLYLNGQLENEAPLGLNTILDPNGLTIGHRVGGAYWTGEIDEPALYDRALSAAEIEALYNARSSGKCRDCAQQPPDIISWWRGEDNVNDAVGGNYGVLLGGATFAPGAVGRAFSFNGTTASVRIPDSPTLDVTTDFTLGAWVKPNAIPVYPNAALVISKVGPIGNLNGYQMTVANIGGTNKIWCGFNTNGGGWPQYTATGGNVPVGEWTYIACTYDHNTLAVHQNGQMAGSTLVGPVTVVNTSSNVKLGSDDVGQQFYSGLIDEPMIVGRALTEVELLAFHDAGGLGVCQTATPTTPGCGAIPTGMLSWWRGEGDALDRRKAHHATLVNDPVFTSGKTGRAFGFAGANEAVDAGSWFNLQTFTIEMWVKPNNGQVQYSNIIDNNHGSSPLRSWVLENFDNGNRYQWYSADFPAGTNIVFELVPDVWQQIVIARDENRVTRGYLNRSLVGSVSTTSDIPYDGTQMLRIGNWYGGNRAFNGSIDEVTIYNRSLSGTEMASLYSADSYGKCVGTQTMADMDGDMLSDLSIFRPSGANGAEWWWLRSTGGNYAVQFGISTDTIVASDYTGDGKTDVAFWRPSSGMWYILRSEDYSFYAFPFGASGDIPAPADYDGDGKTDVAVFRPATATWYVQRSTGGTEFIGFGAAGDKPVPEDYDGDGKADIAVFRPNGVGGAEWWIAQSSGGVFATQFGQPTDMAVPADYTGDGRADIAFWTPTNGYWYILRSDDLSYYAFPFGTSGDFPVPADYDGDARADPGVFRPSNSNWYVNRTTAGILIQQFGAAGDVPVPNEFVR